MKPIVDEAVKRLGLKASVHLVCSPMEINRQNFDQMPVLTVNGETIVQGRVPSIFTMPALIQEAVEKTQKNNISR